MTNQYMQEEDDAILKTYNRYPVVLDHGDGAYLYDPGVTEKEIASRLAHYMVMEGADTKPYGGIVISGAKSSLLHGIPDSKPIEYGDFVLMDYGCQYKGYLSDMTRTVVVGKADAKQREVYDLCRRMTEDTEASVRAGVTGTSCYEASLEAIKDTEYLPYNYTGIGHGVGLFVHELPNIGLNSENILQENSIMTVEPGLYIPGWGGVRLEDQGIITKDGYENLISATHELIELYMKKEDNIYEKEIISSFTCYSNDSNNVCWLWYTGIQRFQER